MPSKFGGVPVEESQSKYGGIPVDEPETSTDNVGMGAVPGSGAGISGVGPSGGQMAGPGVPPALNPIGGARAIGNLAVNAGIESAAGLAGLATLASPLTHLVSDDPSITAENVRRWVRDKMHVSPSDSSRPTLEAIQKTLQPVADWWETYGDELSEDAYLSTGSPGAAALAKVVPDLMAQGLIVGAVPRAAGKAAGAQAMARESKDAAALMREAAPSKKDLKKASSDTFKEIDSLGATVNPQAADSLVTNIAAKLKAEGMHPDVTPRAAGILRHLSEWEGGPVMLSDLETARKVARGAAKSADPQEAMLGSVAIQQIDEFIEGLTPQQLAAQGVNPNQIGVMYRRAREQWGRFRRSEMVDDAIEVAATKRSGFENGLRNEFAKLVEKARAGKIKGFKPHEIAAMERVADGSAGANVFRELGKTGLATGKLGNNWLGAFLTGGGLYAFGVDPLIAISAVAGGTAAKKLALRMTKGNAEFSSSIIRAGADAEKIARAYLRHTPVSQRSPGELSLLFIHRDIVLPHATAEIATNTPLVRQAIAQATETRAAIYGAGGNVVPIRE